MKSRSLIGAVSAFARLGPPVRSAAECGQGFASHVASKLRIVLPALALLLAAGALHAQGLSFQKTPSGISVGSNPQSVAVTDFNGDGIPDVVTANNGNNNLSILLGNGHGGFYPALTITSIPNCCAQF